MLRSAASSASSRAAAMWGVGGDGGGVHGRAGRLRPHQHGGAQMLDRLEGADRLPELFTGPRVLYGQLARTRGRAELLGGREQDADGSGPRRARAGRHRCQRRQRVHRPSAATASSGRGSGAPPAYDVRLRQPLHQACRRTFGHDRPPLGRPPPARCPPASVRGDRSAPAAGRAAGLLERPTPPRGRPGVRPTPPSASGTRSAKNPAAPSSRHGPRSSPGRSTAARRASAPKRRASSSRTPARRAR
ncbi:hypothetical protein SALBM311S_07846 [Streptomyces alboniger]